MYFYFILSSFHSGLSIHIYTIRLGLISLTVYKKKVVCELDQQAQITGQNVYDCPALQASPTNRTSQELKIFPLLFVLHKIYLEMHQMKIQ